MKNLIGKQILTRCNMAGVWVGKVESIDKKNGKLQLTEAYRLWNWQAKEGVSLSTVAVKGLIDGEIPTPVSSIYLHIADCYELIEVTETALRTIKNLSK